MHSEFCAAALAFPSKLSFLQALLIFIDIQLKAMAMLRKKILEFLGEYISVVSSNIMLDQTTSKEVLRAEQDRVRL
jgi:hypothetical protein